MLTRAAIVLLVVLNLGAGAWWWLHAPSPVEAPPAVPAGAARLHLVDDSPATTPAHAAEAPSPSPAKPAPPRAAASASASAPASPSASPTVADAMDAADTTEASAAIACEGGDGAAAGWRVYLPKLPSAEAAQATAARIGEAGFSDYVVVRDGAEVDSVALGRYGTAPAARRRTAALRAAGFPARCARIPTDTPA